ncbi:unnamed protein product [Mucor hiemalis]
MSGFFGSLSKIFDDIFARTGSTSGKAVDKATAISLIDEKVSKNLPNSKNAALKPPVSTKSKSAQQEFASQAIDSMCSQVARYMLYQMSINCPDKALVGNTMAYAFNNRRPVSQRPLPEWEGSCKDGDFAASVEWVAEQAAASTFSNNFVVNCQSCASCVAQYQDALLSINLVHNTNTLSNGLSIRGLPSDSSSTSLSYNSMLLNTTMLMLFLIYFMGFLKK